MKKLFIQIIFIASFFISLNNNAQIINTFAGNGLYGFSGDGGSATNAQLYGAMYVAFDGAGNAYIADRVNARIRKVTTAGIISTFAGNGNTNSAGDGGLAINASIGDPYSVAVDISGNVYIAEAGNNRIRKINTSGIISTIAGTGVAGFSGDGGQAVNAKLDEPHSVAVDAAGNIYITDHNNSRIRKINTSGIISTFAGTGVDGFNGDGLQATSTQLFDPAAVTFYGGDIYIADGANFRVRKVNSAGIVSTVAGCGNCAVLGDGGPAINAQLSNTRGVAFDAVGNMYIADYGYERVRRVGINGIITTFAGTGVMGYSGDGGAPTAAQIQSPNQVIFDAFGNLYISENFNSIIRKITSIPNTIKQSEININDFVIYPSPSNAYVHIESNVAGEKNAILLNCLGEEVYKTNFGSDLKIDVSQLAQGIYFLTIIDNNSSLTRKIVVEH